MDRIEISRDKSRLDLETIHGFLTNSYWAKGRSKETVQKSIEGSFCLGAYLNHQQVGFARAVTDMALFGYIFDVFVLEEYRGRGLGRLLMESLIQHPNLRGVRWMLKTTNAAGLYKKFGFELLSSTEGIYIRQPSAEIPIQSASLSIRAKDI